MNGRVEQAYSIGMTLGVALPYARTQESDADHSSLFYRASTGYDPRQAIAFWRRIHDFGRRRGHKPAEFLSTRRLASTRIPKLDRLKPQAMDRACAHGIPAVTQSLSFVGRFE